MSQIPIINGVYTNEDADFKISYPRNLVPVPKPQGISSGYLRPADGVVQFASGPGTDRGGINWNDFCYRVMGSSLVRVNADGSVTTLGDVGGSASNLVSMDYSFDRLGIVSNGNAYYLDKSTLALTQITDPDLGSPIDLIWIDNYFMFTDGQYLITAELSDPTVILTTKYGSSEVDPDPIVALLKLHNEAYAVNRYTIEPFRNIAGSGFPYQRIESGHINRGAIGTHACCIFLDKIAFVGSGRNEALSVWLGLNAGTERISTNDIDEIINSYDVATLSTILVEAKIDKGFRTLFIHLPDKTLAYDAISSSAVGEPIWYILDTSILGGGQYRIRNHVRCYGEWLVGDPFSSNIGTLTKSVSSHWGILNGWDFGTLAIYNQSLNAIIHELELVALTGRAALGDNSTIWTSYSHDGEVFSTERGISAGKQGERLKRLIWLDNGNINHFRVQKFRGTSDAHVSFARLEARIEGLSV